MTKTKYSPEQLREQIGHLKAIEPKGFLLSWGETPETTFELLCKTENIQHLKSLDLLISGAHQRALVKQVVR